MPWGATRRSSRARTPSRRRGPLSIRFSDRQRPSIPTSAGAGDRSRLIASSSATAAGTTPCPSRESADYEPPSGRVPGRRGQHAHRQRPHRGRSQATPRARGRARAAGAVLGHVRALAGRSGLQRGGVAIVLTYMHGERECDHVQRLYPGDYDVVVDDERQILTSVKLACAIGVTAVLPRQGHYAHDPKELATAPPADVTVE